MLRIALIGLGRWGTKIYNTLKSLEGVEVAVFDVKEADEKKEAAQFDGVIVATPGATHAEVALPFIQAGLPTYIEKPITTSLTEAKGLQRAAEKSGAMIFSGHIHRYNPAYLVAKERVKKAGKIRYLYFEGTNNGPYRDDMSAMWDWAPHDVYLTIDLMGKLPKSIQAWGIETLRPHKRLHDFAVIKMKFHDGRVAISTTSWLLPAKQKKATIVCAKDTIVFDDVAEKKVTVYKGMGPAFAPPAGGATADRPAGKPTMLRQEPEIFYPPYDSKPPLQAELEAFIRCIKIGQEPPTDLEDGFNVVCVLAAAEQSIRLDGRRVNI